VDPRLEVVDSRRDPDQARHLRLVRPLHQVRADPEDPVVAAARRDEDARYLGVDDGIEAVARFAHHVPEGRRERCADGSGVYRARPAHLDAEGASDHAVGAVGADHVPRAYDPDAIAVPHQALGAVVGYVDSQDLAAELHLGPERAGVAEQDRLGVVLRRAEGRRGAQHGGLLLRRQAEGHRLAPVGAGQGLGDEAQPLDVGNAAGADLVLQPPGAQQLHRPRADHGRARMRG